MLLLLACPGILRRTPNHKLQTAHQKDVPCWTTMSNSRGLAGLSLLGPNSSISPKDCWTTNFIHSLSIENTKPFESTKYHGAPISLPPSFPTRIERTVTLAVPNRPLAKSSRITRDGALPPAKDSSHPGPGPGSRSERGEGEKNEVTTPKLHGVELSSSSSHEQCVNVTGGCTGAPRLPPCTVALRHVLC